MRPIVSAHLMGRWGNQLFIAAFARAYAERVNAELRIDWPIGKEVFAEWAEYGDSPKGMTRVKAKEMTDGNLVNVELFADYCQHQDCLLYTRAQLRQWFRLKPKYEALRERLRYHDVVAHRRVGDTYNSSYYPIVSVNSYIRACAKFNVDARDMFFLQEELPLRENGLPGELGFLPDFLTMMNARILLRGNSTFSIWAAWLAKPTQRVFAPVTAHLPSGEHDVDFVEGNWPRVTGQCGDFLTDLHLSET